MASPAPPWTPERRQRLVDLLSPGQDRPDLPRPYREAIDAALAELDRRAGLAEDWEQRANRLRMERDSIRELAHKARNESDDLADVLDCLDQIGQMVGFGQAGWGPDDRQRLIREVREALERTRAEGRTDGTPFAT